MTHPDDEKTDDPTREVSPADADAAREISPADDAATPDKATPTRTLLLLRAGPARLAVFADESDGAVPLTRPAPLPFAPPAVLGVVAARGRMRTVIDPLPLLGLAPAQPPAKPDDDTASDTAHAPPPRHALLLSGDEQLALAIDGVGPTIDIDPARLLPPDPAHDFARASLQHEGSQVHVLHPARLFDAATRGMERRRRRQ